MSALFHLDQSDVLAREHHKRYKGALVLTLRSDPADEKRWYPLQKQLSMRSSFLPPIVHSEFEGAREDSGSVVGLCCLVFPSRVQGEANCRSSLEVCKVGTETISELVGNK